MRDLFRRVSKQYRPWLPEQAYLLPPSPMEWLPEGHLAYFLLEVVSELDLGAIEALIHQKDPRGERPYAPRMMTSLILYAYCTGTFSSRKIERGTFEDVALRVIAGGSHPHWTTINSFRLQHRVALAGLFTQVLKMCARSGLRTVGHVALDGSKVPANASKHKAMSYGRMKDEEKRLAAEIEALLRQAEAVDAMEDKEFGSSKRGDELPEELMHRESRLRRIREVKAELEKEAAQSRAAKLRENAAALTAKLHDPTASAREKKLAATLAAKSETEAEKLAPRDDDDDDDGNPSAQLSLHRVQTTAVGKPKDTAQRNFTDADSRIMIRNGVFLQAYNAQAAVSEDQLVVAHAVTNDGTDAGHLTPMIERVYDNCGALPKVLSADTGYLSEANITYCAKSGIDAYIPVRKSDAAKLTTVPDSEKLIAHWAMHDKVSSRRGKKIYALRKILVEPVFGQIKSAMGFRHFSLRGLQKVASEWGIVCACHNLLKLFRALRLTPKPA
jgi:transposase